VVKIHSFSLAQARECRNCAMAVMGNTSGSHPPMRISKLFQLTAQSFFSNPANY
jgi:hypothetical protein